MDNLEWYAKVDRSVDDILDMIKNKGTLPSSTWFETEEEAQIYAFNVSLATGKQCHVYHRDSNPGSVYSTVRELLRKSND